jgi:hypothetical protein
MTARTCLAVAVVALLGASEFLGAQLPERLDAGAGAGSGGSVFGWQPRVGVNGSVRAVSLGMARLDWHGALARVTAPIEPGCVGAITTDGPRAPLTLPAISRDGPLPPGSVVVVIAWRDGCAEVAPLAEESVSRAVGQSGSSSGHE